MNKRVLVIDDSPTLRKLLKLFLVNKGYIVKEAQNGKIGLKYISEDDYDLIILDLNMPVMNGYEVLKKLKTMDTFSSPILILSADKEEETKATGISMGASYYITKPFKPNDVVLRIEEIFKETEPQKTN